MNALANLSPPPLAPRAATTDLNTAHPKVARRPAQWKRVATQPTPDAPEAVTTPAKSANRPWQEDAAFSTIMVLIVLALNVVLFSTTQSSKPHNDTSVMIQQLTRESVLPTPRYNPNDKVKSFVTDEETSGDAAIRSFVEEHEKLLKQLERAPRSPYGE
ncbi:MAG: hypothetical protein J0M34_08275 [Alphaproteobacteria bacterium]|nr:hypothetical protein [Alphaproteobacteria bacterium]